MSEHTHDEELEMLKWPAPLADTWAATVSEDTAGRQIYTITEDGDDRGVITVEYAKDSKVRYAYPVGLHDRLLTPSADTVAEAIQLVSEKVWEAHQNCRRLVIATTEEDIPEIARAEKAGYRYVVDVDLPQESVTLMAAEPGWVLEESRNIDLVPGS